MDSGVAVASARQRGVLALAAAVLIAPCFGPRSVPAAECGTHCERRIHPSQYSDPRCESRRNGPHLDRIETRCDLREPRRKANQPTPSALPLPSAAVPPVGRAPAIGASEPGRQQFRNVDRDVGFDDAFTTPGSAPTGVSGANANTGGAAAPAAESRRTPPGRAR